MSLKGEDIYDVVDLRFQFTPKKENEKGYFLCMRAVGIDRTIEEKQKDIFVVLGSINSDFEVIGVEITNFLNEFFSDKAFVARCEPELHSPVIMIPFDDKDVSIGFFRDRNDEGNISGMFFLQGSGDDIEREFLSFSELIWGDEDLIRGKMFLLKKKIENYSKVNRDVAIILTPDEILYKKN